MTDRRRQAINHRARIAARRHVEQAPDAELVLLATAGDRYAADILCQRSRRLVMWTVQRFDSIPGVERDDLEQLAYTGLLRAITTHNADRSSLATWSVRQMRAAIAAGLPDLKPGVRLPAALGKRVAKARSAATEVPGEPTAANVAEALGVTEDVAAELLALTSLDRPAEIDDSCDAVAVEDQALAAVEDAAELAPMLEVLSGIDRQVIELRHGLTAAGPQTVAATAAAIGCHPSTVRRAEKRALAAMRGAS